MGKLSRAWLAGLALMCCTSLAQAQTPFYAGKTIQLIVGFGTGGGYDLWARTLARHMNRYIEGKPSIVVQNMPGAGSYAAANHIYSVAPKDGTVIGLIARDAAVGPLTGAPGARYDASKFAWIGTPGTDHSVCVAYHTAKVKTAQDLFSHELIVGDVGAGGASREYPLALSRLLGMKFRLISGFHASTDVFLAMERGEVEGMCESYDSVKGRHEDWLADGRLRVILQGGEAPNHELGSVPFVLDLARTEDDRKALSFLYSGMGIGRPFIAPPGLPAERVATLRAAFEATMKDPEFMADAKRQKLVLEPSTGEHLAAIVDRLYATSPAVIERVGSLIK